MRIIPNINTSELNGELWAIVAYYNPYNIKARILNFERFYHNLKKQNVKVIVGELASSQDKLQLNQYISFGDKYYYWIDERACYVWQKERILNNLLSLLPLECDKVCWLDSDIIFEKDDWADCVSELLNYYNVIQPFEYIYIDKDINKKVGIISSYINNGKNGMLVGRGHPGFGCSFRRNIIENVKFYEYDIFGSGDRCLMNGVLGEGRYINFERMSYENFKNYSLWEDSISKIINGSYYYLEGSIIHHLYHGARNKRGYQNRDILMKQYNYNPITDIGISENKLLYYTNLMNLTLKSMLIRSLNNG